MVRNIGMGSNYMDKYMMRKMITTMFRLRKEYAETVWSSYKKKKHVNKLERIQRMVTKMVPELEGLQYRQVKGNKSTNIGTKKRKERLDTNL